MPSFGEVTFTLTEARVARWNADNTYGTSVALEYMQNFSITPEHDTDDIMAGGQLVELLSVMTHATGNWGQGLIQFDALAVITGDTPSSDGSTPNQTTTVDFTTGGRGLPYFGLVGKVMATGIAELHFGLYKVMLDAKPNYTWNQNEFSKPETGFRAITPTAAIGSAVRIIAYETETELQDDLDVFFAQAE